MRVLGPEPQSSIRTSTFLTSPDPLVLYFKTKGVFSFILTLWFFETILHYAAQTILEVAV